MAVPEGNRAEPPGAPLATAGDANAAAAAAAAVPVAAAPAAAEGRAARTAGRAAFLDHLKVALTALVMLHHLAISFGAAGDWYYRDPAAPDSLGLSVFTVINQSFFMALFFFVSGYFTPGSVDRKGARRFLADRVIRLLMPVAVFGVAIAPGLEYVKRTSLGVPTPSLLAYYPQRIAELREFDPGPLWFLWALFLFNLGYLAWRAMRPGATGVAVAAGAAAAAAATERPPQPRSTSLAVLAGIAAVIIALTALVRLRWPIGVNVLHIQIAYLPQYVVLFSCGIAAHRRRSLDALSPRLLPLGAVTAVAGAALVAAGFAGADQQPALFLGHAHWQAMLWAAGESLLCLGLSAALLVAFQRFTLPGGRLSRELDGGAFAAYIVHPPIIVLAALAASQLAVPPLAKLALTAALAVPCCFAVGITAHRAPGLRRVL